MKAILPLLTALLSGAVSPSNALDNNRASSFITNELSEVLTAPQDPDDWQQQIYCTIDASNSEQPIVDEDACKSRVDDDSNPCVWCSLPQNPFIQGACISESQAEAAGQLCTSSDERGGDSTFLRGSSVGGDWDFLDPFCLSGDDTSNNSEDCSTKTDSNGDSCIWCEAAGVFGQCVSRSQKDFFGNYLDCAEVDVEAAVE